MKAVFTLPFVRSIPIYWNHVSNYNYNPYEVFSIKSFVFSWIYNFLNPNYDIQFVGHKQDYDVPQEIYQLDLKIMNGKDVAEIDEQQWKTINDIINTIIDKYLNVCLLVSPWTSFFSETCKIPQLWIKQMLPLLVNDNIKIFNNESDDEFHNIFKGSLYIDLSQSDKLLTYDKIYEDIKLKLNEQINNYWDQSVMLLPSNNIINKWNLKHVKDNYYKPSWNNRRLNISYSGIWNFLHTWDDKSPSRIKVSHNWVMRHYIAKAFRDSRDTRYQDFYFDQYYLWIIINNYDHLVDIEKQIEKYEGLSEGRTLLLGFPTLSQAKKIEEKCHKLNYNDTIIYNYDNVNSFYRLSIMLKMDDDELSIRKTLLE